MQIKVRNFFVFPVVLGLLTSCGEQPDQVAPTEQQPQISVEEAYVGSQVCADCHVDEYARWQGSHHHMAMQPATADSVVGDFGDTHFEYAGIETSFSRLDGSYVVRTDGPSGELQDFSVQYTFGIAPLQQYLLEGPRGRLQALGVSWDARAEVEGGGRWFHLHPDETVDHKDVLHWTRPSANWNFMCADCHSTALMKNYDQATKTYSTQFAEVSVGCEACHGQGARHVAWAQSDDPDAGMISISRMATQQDQMNTCAQCHSRRSQLVDGFTPDKNLFDFYLPALLDEGLYHADGQILDEVYVYGSFSQSKMHEQGVTCGNCHEPHSNQLRIEGNGVCTQCHNPAGRADFPSLPKMDFESTEHHFHPTDSAGARCVSCHMSDKTYMVVDDRRDHSFRIPRPDLSVSLGVPNACTDCHTEQTAQWAKEALQQHYPEPPKPHYGSVFAAARRGEASAEVALTAIANDASQPAIIRATALSLMVGYSLRGSSVAIDKALNDEHPLVRIGALRGAQRWAPEQQWQKTRRLLDDEVLAVRVEAVRGLMNVQAGLGQAEQLALRPYLERYLQTVSFNADVAEGQSGMAGVHLALNDIPAAEAALKTSIELNPQWVPGLINLADLYRSTGRDTQAGPLLERALELAPDSSDVLLGKALWLVRQGQAEAGLPLLAEAWGLNPNAPRYAYVYAVALHSVGRSVEALQVADKTLALRRDEQLLETAFGIARDANLREQMEAYGRALSATAPAN